MIKFGLSIYGISRKIISKEITPEEGITWLFENGAEAIELVPFGMDLKEEPALIERIGNCTAKLGCSIDNYSLNADFLQKTPDEVATEIARTKFFIDACNTLKIPTIRVDCAGYRRPLETNTIESFNKELSKIAEVYQTLCEYASQYNIKVLLENHGFHVNGADRVRAVIKNVNCSNFGHQLDIGNFICVDENCTISVKKMLQFATTIHMKDFYIRPFDRDPGDATQFDCSGSWFRSLDGTYLRGSILGQGDLDIYRILSLIKQSQFDGNVFVEYEGIEDCFYGTKVSLDNLKRIYSLV